MNRKGSLSETKKLDDLITILRKNILNLKKDYRVKSIGIFGSYVHNEQRDKSDLDILVEFTETPSLIGFMRVEHHLSDILGIKVDLVMKDALKPLIGKHILEEVITI
ncbi:MAG: nucleotidyltransferase family protein [Actinobacteria bacterium]|nr:nucleotidyltransferase family protein [Actinomycetota bacterium]